MSQIELIEDATLPRLESRQQPQSGSDITIAQRMLSACTGSLLTSLVVTPFDVVRIRLQQQQLLFPPHFRQTATCCKKVFWEDVTKAKKDYFCSSNACAQEFKINGTFSGLTKIAVNEGVFTLYRGLSLMLIMAVPSNMVYFSGYEYLRDRSPLKDQFPIFNPLLCGSFARIMAATVVAPLELIKTRLQAVPTSTSTSSEIMKMVVTNSFKEVQNKGIFSLFKGLQLTLWRDVPFSGIYWSSYEYLNGRLQRLQTFNSSEHEHAEIFARSFISGSLSGVLAAIFTNPFDVGKTRLQVTLEDTGSLNKLVNSKSTKESMFKSLHTIYKNEGMSSLFVGLAPRCLKIAPSCAIMISTYEISKKLFADMI
ncbi:hypothetical protein KL942_000162 [Ogataea angusta]|uniref:Mitochondrial carrier protein MTM1 n=1 Tax=Pichia angusta TaxID=870730 RepID=A0AAN6I6M7_PICAN|nr:uncharacterized protein KL928_000957 [Ogataea angusta]KAG7820873.1 hypothetical protein KL928_000957 [Ogataea angusta]KAG7826427.1 hypothetical protein KL909_000479 [Ogataea angusta]KAG7843066.1 hypothetical protein KL942_000162 [Ogataea angusta]KAG7851283.1 hypothetical protein KL941_000952 [Ogataea angusta]KAG7852782.1 hypothetical protein KL940_000483 [Ogataea angusta]